VARFGSGLPAARAPADLYEWQAGSNHESSYAFSIATPSHWDLVDCITIVVKAQKPSAHSKVIHSPIPSPLQTARVTHSEQRCPIAISYHDTGF
jgi:mevalonate pyrophosphate decarboxylase